MLRKALFFCIMLAGLYFSAFASGQQPQAVASDKSTVSTAPNSANIAKLTTGISEAYYRPEALAGIDCSVVVDWEPFMTALKVDMTSDEGKRELGLLRGLKVHSHAMRGRPAELTFDWSAGPPDSRDQIEGGLRQTIAGFYQSYWGFFDMAEIKPSDVTRVEPHADSTSTLYVGDSNTNLTVDVDKEGTPTHYKIGTPALNATIDLSYVPSDPPAPGDARRISEARIVQYLGESTVKVNMKLDYQPADTFFVPRHVSFDIPGSLSMGFEFSSCLPTKKTAAK